MLLGIIFIYSHYGTTNLYVLNHVHISNYRQILLWLAFFLSFGSKIPMVPFIYGYLKLMSKHQPHVLCY